MALNCAALTPTLVEAELFGHEQGAFTGASRERAGRFEAADGGTLLLDEIGLVPLEAQEKLLRVVEYGTFERVVHRADGGPVGADSVDFDPFRRSGEPVKGPDASPSLSAGASPSAGASLSTGATATAPPSFPASLPDAVARVEIEALRGALQATRHHQRKAATLLGLSYHQFRGLYRKHATQLED